MSDYKDFLEDFANKKSMEGCNSIFEFKKTITKACIEKLKENVNDVEKCESAIWKMTAGFDTNVLEKFQSGVNMEERCYNAVGMLVETFKFKKTRQVNPTSRDRLSLPVPLRKSDDESLDDFLSESGLEHEPPMTISPLEIETLAQTNIKLK